MTPAVCFSFCRERTASRFFGIIHGRDCYCTEYFHDTSTAGVCDLPCDGDRTVMCGGNIKASLFEMHVCADGGTIADATVQSARIEARKAYATSAAATMLYESMHTLAVRWQFPVCSKSKYICPLSGQWDRVAHDIYEVAYKCNVTANGTLQDAQQIKDLQPAAAAGTVEAVAPLEAAVEQAKDSLADTAVAAANVDMTVTSANGPLGGTAANADFEALYQVATSRLDYHSLCDLEQLSSYAVIRENNPAFCGELCLGSMACSGFNLQFVDGMLSCQLLSSTGIFRPSDSLVDAVPTYEVSKTKVSDMKLEAVDCYMKKGFLSGNGGRKLRIMDTVYLTNTTA